MDLPAPPPTPYESPTGLVGQTVGHFRITGKLGAGGMGVVYRATDTELRRTVALKVLEGGAATDDRKRHRLLREARSSAAVTHPNIATVFEVFEAGGLCLIALEYIEGRTLRQVLSEARTLDLGYVLDVARQVAEALAKAHSVGVIHRDLTPDNIMVTNDGHVKVLDFGLAKTVDVGLADGADSTQCPSHPPSGDGGDRSSVVTQRGRLIGTPAYMAPEQVAGAATDLRTDIFSLGVVLYELLAGERPFFGETVTALGASIERCRPAPFRAHRRRVSKRVEALVFKCLEKDPNGRFADCPDLLRALALAQNRDLRFEAVRASRDSAPDGQSAADEDIAPSPWRTPLAIALVSALAGVAVFAAPRASDVGIEDQTMRAQFELGERLDRKGDKAGACAVYQALLERWGSARPLAQTAEAARVRAIHCAAKTAGQR